MVSMSAPAAMRPILTRAADGIRAVGEFGESAQWSYNWQHVYTRDQYLDLVPTQGNMAQLPDDKLAEVLNGTGAAIDALGGTFTMTCYTAVVAAVRGEHGPCRRTGARLHS